MSLQRFASILALAVLVCAFAWTAAAQENKELVTSQDPFILEPPTTSLDTSGHVNLPPVESDFASGRSTSGVTSPSGAQSRREAGARTEGDQKAAKPERQTPKNVMRIDNKNKRKVQPVAVIKAQLSPWGYTRRYLEGDVSQPEHPYGSGMTQGPGATGIGGRNTTRLGSPANISIGGGGRRSSRHGRDSER